MPEARQTAGAVFASARQAVRRFHTGAATDSALLSGQRIVDGGGALLRQRRGKRRAAFTAS